MYNILLKWIILLFSVAVTAYPQKYPITIFSSEAGFPPFPVEGILQDHLGNMWFTTQGGLVRYNGKQFTHFTMEQGLGYDFCRPILEDKNQDLWVGTLGGGLTRIIRNDYGEYDFTVFNESNGLNDNSVLSLAADSSQSIWIGTKNGVSRLSFNSDNHSAGWIDYLTGKMINHILIGSDNSVWCGDVGGYLYRIRNGQCDTIRIFGEYSSGISGMIEISPAEYHIASFNNGARKLFIKQNRYQIDSSRSEKIFLSRRIYGLLKDKRSRLLAVTRGDGLIISDGKTLRRMTMANGLPEDQIACVYEDRQRNVWIGSMSGALCKWPDFPVVHYDDESGLPGNNVLSLIQDHSGAYWFITNEKGLSRFDGKLWKNFTTKQGLPTNSLYAIFEDSEGDIWISTFGLGLVRYDGRRFTRFHPDYFILNDVLCIYEDSGHNMWFGTDVDGVVRYNKHGQLTVFNMSHGLAGQRVLAIHEDSKGNLWLGCAQPTRMKEAGGVSVISAEEKISANPVFQNFNKRTGLKSQYVSSIHQTGEGAIWVATRYHGLVKYSGDSLQYYSVKDGLPSNTITGIAEDSVRRLWIATNKGLAVRDEQTFKSITRDHGLFSNEINENAILCDRLGSIWLGVPNGVTAYHGQMTNESDIGPTLYIDHGKNQEQLLPVSRFNDLRYDQNHLAFEMTGIDFRFNRGLRYQYFLDGFDPDRRSWTERDYVSYTNLDPGSYQLHLRVKNINDQLSRDYTWSVVIHPAFWQTWWFRIILLIIVMVLSPLMYKYTMSAWNLFQHWRKSRYIAHYKIVSVLGEGAMGIVFQARDRYTKKPVALKVMHPKAMTDNENKSRFERESHIMASLDHPNVVKVYAVGYSQGMGYIAMELLSGGNLKSWNHSQSGTGFKILFDIAVQIADGLAYIHQKGIIHRDLKSDNIMMNDRGKPKIMDFGLSKSTLLVSMTQSGSAMGTLGYISPEQITGSRADERSDIFSFGVVLYELVTGRLPFNGDNEIALIHSILTEEPIPPGEIIPDCPAAFEAVIRRCLKKDPGQRYQNTDEAILDLRNINNKYRQE